MINLVALTLLMASFAGAGIFSPTPQNDVAQTIVKDGHRVVVVEYDQNGNHNTKISITPDHSHDGAGDQSGDIKTPKELICDAYGKCKHKIANVMGRAKEEVEDVGKAKGKVSDAVNNVQAKAKWSWQGAKEVGENVVDTVSKAKEKTKETGGAMSRDISSNVSDTVRNVGSYIGSKETIDNMMSIANLVGFANAYGLCVWVTFISSYVLCRAMPRQQFGVVQSKIYPVYFKCMAYSVGLAAVGHILRHRTTLFFSKAEMLQVYNLMVSLLSLFVNCVYLEPRATKVMFERMKIEKEEGRGRADLTPELGKGSQHATVMNSPTADAATIATPTKEVEHDVVRSRIIRLNDKLKRLNSYSSLLNILTLMSLTWHLVYLAQCLHSC